MEKQELITILTIVWTNVVGKELDGKEILRLTNEILRYYPNMKKAVMKQRLRNGMLGKYGRTYKLTLQELSYWLTDRKKQQDRL